jgi:hypothetical protein
MTTALVPGTISPAQEAPSRVGSPRPSLNLYGVTGLIDMPSAESQPDGQLAASWSRFGNTQRLNFTFQILPRLSATFRYATIYDWGDPDNPDDEQDLFDRSMDLQFQLLKERGAFQPSLAVGFRDFLGTGVYSSEYLVATKTVAEDFTVSAGIGWGRLSSNPGAENPFCAISDAMCDRDEDFGEGGDVAWGRFFAGEDIGFFGGVEWRTPIDKLTLKAEYSSDAYDREEENSDFRVRSPVNFGAEYRLTPGITLGGYYMYGDTVGVNVVFSGNPKNPIVAQNLDPAPVPVNPRPPGGRGTDWVNDTAAREQVIDGVSRVLSDEGITVQSVKFSPTAVDVEIINRRINEAPKAIGRTARVLAAGMPYSVETFRITIVENGVPTTTVTVDRTDLERQTDRPQAALESWENVSLEGAQPALTGDDVWRREVYPLNDWAIVPVPSVQFFGGNEGFRPQLSIEFRDTLRLSRGMSITGRIRQPILGAYSDPGPGDDIGTLPPVRSQSDRYYSGWQPKLMRLTGDYLFKLNPDTYGRASLGYIERAFAGVSTEVLWKPVQQNWGLGAELNYVWQRDFEGLGFGYYDYDVVMGHASLYWDTGWYDIEAQVDLGRYLAGDWGGTLALTRQFANGWLIGAYVTKTNVSAEEFGEGSYNKGVVLNIPLRWTTPFETRQTIVGDLTSLGSNGGAQLNVANRLYPTVREYDKRRLERSWGQFWQ